MCIPSRLTYQIWQDTQSHAYSIAVSQEKPREEPDKWQKVEITSLNWVELSKIIHGFVKKCETFEFLNHHLQLVKDLKSDLEKRVKVDCLDNFGQSKTEDSPGQDLIHQLNRLKYKISFHLLPNDYLSKNAKALEAQVPGIFYIRRVVDYEWQLEAIPLRFPKQS